MGKILSIAVPSYNVEKYLNKCLDSFSDDRLKEGLEVLIVNDGSTDRTEEIANEYVARYPEIFQLINKENGGHGSAVNAGIEHATGKYFRIVDGDDWVNTDNMVKLLGILEETNTDLVVDEKREVHMVTGNTEFFPLPKHVPMGRALTFETVCNHSELFPYIMLHTLSTKTALLKKYGIRLQEHIFYVDIEYIIKATCESKSITFYDLEIYQYLIGNVNQSVSAQNYVKRYEHHNQVVKELVRYATEAKVSEQIRKYLDRQICLLLNSHYNISLIFNEDRKEGMKQAKEFRAYLKKANMGYYKATTKRFMQATTLHYLGVNYDKLNRLKGRQ